MMTDSQFSLLSFSLHKSGVIRRQVGVKSASSRRQVGAKGVTARIELPLLETCGSSRRPFSRGSGEDLKTKGSPLCLEKTIKI